MSSIIGSRPYNSRGGRDVPAELRRMALDVQHGTGGLRMNRLFGTRFRNA